MLGSTLNFLPILLSENPLRRYFLTFSYCIFWGGPSLTPRCLSFDRAFLVRLDIKRFCFLVKKSLGIVFVFGGGLRVQSIDFLIDESMC